MVLTWKVPHNDLQFKCHHFIISDDECEMLRRMHAPYVSFMLEFQGCQPLFSKKIKNAPRLFHLCFLSSKNALGEARGVGYQLKSRRGAEFFFFTEKLDNYISPLPPVDWIFKKCPFSAIYAQYFEKCPYAHRKKNAFGFWKMLFLSKRAFENAFCQPWIGYPVVTGLPDKNDYLIFSGISFYIFV